MTDHYCAAPFSHIALECSNSSYRPCCAWHHSQPSPITDTDVDPMNHPWMQDLRAHMLGGTPHPGCVKCYSNEVAKGWSMRREFNQANGRMTAANLTYVEMNFGNLCNLKCRMCGSWGSSRWIADEIKLGNIPQALVRRTIDDIHVDLANLQRIKFIGGEVSLEQTAMREALSRIAQARGSLDHLEVEIITNATIAFETDILDMLSGCRKVMMTVSMDGIGSWNDYQRTGSVWANVADVAMLYYARTAPNWQLVITSCITIYTIGGVIDLLDWVAAELPLAKHICQPAFDPREQILRNLPYSYKCEMIDMIEQWVPANRDLGPPWLLYGLSNPVAIKQSLIWHLSQDPNCSLDAVRSCINQLDSLRNEHLSQQNPKLFQHLFG